VQFNNEGKNITEVCRLLNRTRPWVYKWINRFKSGDPEWYLDVSKAPKNKPNKTHPNLEDDIAQSRKKLSARDTPETKYAYCGAIAIHQELDTLGYADKPSLSTINRILKRRGLIEKDQSKQKSKKEKHYYPQVRAQYPGHVQQLDLVTPRYIRGYGKIISVNRIDVYSNQANLDQYDSKGADSILLFIIDDWRTYGIPAYLQIDNEASFRGSLYHQRTFGKLTRFCLNFGVEMIFIPFREPWRNGCIENFNGLFEERVWNFENFTDLSHIKRESKKYRDKHNHYQAYKKEHFSKQKSISYTTSYFPKNFTFDVLTELPITKGRVHFTRFIDENGYINVLNESIYVNKKHSCEYVWATIFTDQQKLKIYYKATQDAPTQIIKTMSYKLREPVKDRIPINTFCG
jgi:putative transposase